MSKKIYIPEGESAPASQIGATLDALATTISARREAGEESYTHRLLSAKTPDSALKKVMEEAGEVSLAAKDVDACRNSVEADDAVDHLRYEAADVVYHLMVVLERYGISIDEFAAELNNRMTEEERPRGGARLYEEFVKRGK